MMRDPRLWATTLGLAGLLSGKAAFADLSDDVNTPTPGPAPAPPPANQTLMKPGSKETPHAGDTKPEPARASDAKGTRSDKADKSEKVDKADKGDKGKKEGGKHQAQPDRRKIPIHLSSEGNSTYSPDGVLKFPESVIVTQGDVKLEANAADVFFIKNQGNQESIDHVDMRGNVRVTRFSDVESERMNARGDRAVFKNIDRKVTLIGNARVVRNGSTVDAKQITYDLDTGLITIDKAKGIVKPEDATTIKGGP